METKQIIVYVNQALYNLEENLFRIPNWSYGRWESWFCSFLEIRGVYDSHREACSVLFLELGRRGVKIVE